MTTWQNPAGETPLIFPDRTSSLRLAAMLATALLVASITAPATAGAGEVENLQATFISKVALFVKWPEGAFASADAPIRVGILGEARHDDALTRVLTEAKTRGRSYEVQPVISVEEARQYHILIVNETRSRDLRRIARDLNGASVLSIARSFPFAESGGILGIEMHRGKVAFEVNNRAAQEANLKISSRLLRLATTVY